jgi:7,8-dihydropterin-6-yl-methyl-4-(beta-D-ribofuranosyl)aminobenzene 5'-phosphate synthase
MRLIIVYDNEAKNGLKPDWGFSCLIENNKKILFDTGADSKILLYNMKKLNINPKDIDIVIISHHHQDHEGGLNGFLKANGNKAKVIWPDKKESFKIIEGVYSTGVLRSFVGPEEQSLFLKTKKGLVVLVGCSHPGVDKILDSVKKYGKIYAIIGGFHGFRKLDALKRIEIIGACHCTQFKEEIKEKYLKTYREIKAGSIIKI